MTGRSLNVTASLRFPKRWWRYRPHRPYRPTPRIHKGLRVDGTSPACVLTAHDAPNRASTFAHGPRGRQASTPWPSGKALGGVGKRVAPTGGDGRRANRCFLADGRRMLRPGRELRVCGKTLEYF